MFIFYPNGIVIFPLRQLSGKPASTRASGVKLFVAAQRGGDAFPAVVGELSTVAFICVFMCNRVKVVFGLVGAGAPLPRWPGTPTTRFSSGVSFTIHEQKS